MKQMRFWSELTPIRLDGARMRLCDLLRANPDPETQDEIHDACNRALTDPDHEARIGGGARPLITLTLPAALRLIMHYDDPEAIRAVERAREMAARCADTARRTPGGWEYIRSERASEHSPWFHIVCHVDLDRPRITIATPDHPRGYVLTCAPLPEPESTHA